MSESFECVRRGDEWPPLPFDAERATYYIHKNRSSACVSFWLFLWDTQNFSADGVTQCASDPNNSKVPQAGLTRLGCIFEGFRAAAD
jgi:hypothetical protein